MENASNDDTPRNCPETGATALRAESGVILHDDAFDAPGGGNSGNPHGIPAARLRELWDTDVIDLSFAEALALVEMQRERLAKVEASAEVFIVARHDLMVAVDAATSRYRAYPGWECGDPLNCSVIAGQFKRAAILLDRLAAYMKGQDDRIVALGDACDMQRAAYDLAREAATIAIRERDEATASFKGPEWGGLCKQAQEYRSNPAADPIAAKLVGDMRLALLRETMVRMDAVAEAEGMAALVEDARAIFRRAGALSTGAASR